MREYDRAVMPCYNGDTFQVAHDKSQIHKLRAYNVQNTAHWRKLGQVIVLTVSTTSPRPEAQIQVKLGDGQLTMNAAPSCP